MASLQIRNGKWQVQVRRHGHTPRAQSFQTKSDAKRWARQIEAELDRTLIPNDVRALIRVGLRAPRTARPYRVPVSGRHVMGVLSPMGGRSRQAAISSRIIQGIDRALSLQQSSAAVAKRELEKGRGLVPRPQLANTLANLSLPVLQWLLRKTFLAEVQLRIASCYNSIVGHW
jgi:hypothetical protein